MLPITGTRVLESAGMLITVGTKAWFSMAEKGLRTNYEPERPSKETYSVHPLECRFSWAVLR